MDTMKAAVYYGPSDLRIEQVPIPEINADECLVRVTYCGICKTDVKKIKGITLSTKGSLDPPRIFGHEIVGEIAEIGDNLKGKNIKKGDRVAIFHHVPCLKCYFCLRGNFTQCKTYRETDTTAGVGKPSGGGFAEYVKLPKIIAERGIVKIPDNVDYETAVFIEPTNCCIKGIKKANISLGDSVIIFGQGPIGLTLDQLAALDGAKTIIAVDLVDYRLKYAKEHGFATHTINAQKEDLVKKVMEITNGIGADRSIVAVESPEAINNAIRCTRGGGDVVFFSEFGGEQGEPFGELGQIIDIIYGKEINIHGCYSSSYLDHDLAAKLIFSGTIKTKELTSHTLPLEELSKAIEIADKRRHLDWEGKKKGEKPRESLKIIIKI